MRPHLQAVRNLLALMMLVILALSGATPACARPMAMPHAMAHHAPMPGHCGGQAAAHDCIGCGMALPDAVDITLAALLPTALAPVARRDSPLVDAAPPLPLRPPQA